MIPAPIRPFTPRQEQVLELLAEGKEREEVAKLLGISLSRVKTIISDISLLIPNPRKLRNTRAVLMYAIGRDFQRKYEQKVAELEQSLITETVV